LHLSIEELSSRLVELYEVLPPLLRQTQALAAELDRHSHLIARHLQRQNHPSPDLES
jgi:hypothetical protein